jgi:hypothetical protein
MQLSTEGLLIILLVGAVAGWLAGKISLAQNVHMQVQITDGLRNRNTSIPEQLNSLELELPAELASLHQNSPVPKTP